MKKLPHLTDNELWFNPKIYMEEPKFKTGNSTILKYMSLTLYFLLILLTIMCYET